MRGDTLSPTGAMAANIRRAPCWLTLATLCAAVLIAQLDSSVVNLAVRPIGRYFDARLSALQWVVDGYNVVYAAFLLTGGLLADLYGRRRVFMAGAAVFTAASVVCALSPAIPMLVIGRAFAGFGAAMLLPASLSIIRVAWPDPLERARVLGIWAGCNGVAVAIGPTLGGLLIDTFGWRSIFLIVIPLGFGALLAAPFGLPESSDPKGRRFDPSGQALGALTLGVLAAGAIESQHSIGISALAFAGAALSLTWFIKVESRGGAEALVHLDMFRVGEFRGAMAATGAMTFGMYGVLFLLPLTWQRSGLLGPLGAGIALMPMALVFVCVSSFSGILTARLGSRPMTAGGVAVIGCGLLLIGATAGTNSLVGAEVGLGLTGLGMGLATGPLMGAAVGAFSAARSGSAAALVNVARMIGATLGVAVLGTVYAFARGGSHGLSLAMAVGGGVQLAGAAFGWSTSRSE